MALIGKMHPMLVHFPIGLVLASATAELLPLVTRRATWRAVSVASVRAGAVMGVVRVMAEWQLAPAPFVEPTGLLTLQTLRDLAAAASASAAALIPLHPHTHSRRSAVA